MMTNNPTPDQIKQARHSAGLTQAQAAEFCCVTLGAFQHWEYGVRKMPESTWKLFKILIAMQEPKDPWEPLLVHRVKKQRH